MTDPEMEKRLKSLEKQYQELKDEIRGKEVKQLKWGIYLLGAIVLAMGGWIWAQVEHLVSLKVGK